MNRPSLLAVTAIAALAPAMVQAHDLFLLPRSFHSYGGIESTMKATNGINDQRCNHAMKLSSDPYVSAWRGQFQLGDRWALWQGEIGDGVLHRHFAAQAIVSDGPVRVFDHEGRYVEAECVLIDPLAPHRVAPGQKAALIYIEPGKRMEIEAKELLKPIRSATAIAIVSSPGSIRFWSSWLSSPARFAEAIDERLSAALDFIERALAFGPVPLAEAASMSRLSPDRFRHLFADQMGLSYKRYVLWRRLRLASTCLMEGQDVTTAAHAAGFSDAAHFARTIKSTFGVTASQSLINK